MQYRVRKHPILLVPALLLGLSLGAAARAASDEELAAARAALAAAREELARASAQLAELTAGEAAAEAIEIEQRSVFAGGRRPVIGVVLGGAAREGGVRLAAVTPGGPADRAGLASGDRIVAINGVTLAGRDPQRQAYEIFDGMAAGDVFDLEVVTGEGETRQVSVEAKLHRPTVTYAFSTTPHVSVVLDDELIDLEGMQIDTEELAKEMEHLREELHLLVPPAPDAPAPLRVWQFGMRWSGLELARLNPGLARYFDTDRGVLVLDASGLGDTDLQAGDVIQAINGREVQAPRDLMRELRELPGGARAELELLREGERLAAQITAPEAPPAPELWRWREDRKAPRPPEAPRPQRF